MEKLFTQTTLKHFKNRLLAATKTGGIVCAALILGVQSGYAQAPTISYASPQTYQQGIPITPLAPTSSGVGPVGYSTDVLFSGLSQPSGIAVDKAGNLYITDSGHNLVKMFPSNGGDPVNLGSGFNFPYGIAVDASGNVFISDQGNNAVKEIPVGGGAPVTLASGLSDPSGLAVDLAGNVYVADYGDRTVKKIPAGGGAPVSVGSGFGAPLAVAVDAAGNIYVGDTALRKISAADGSTTIVWADDNSMTGVAIDSAGNIFTAEVGQKYQIVKLHEGQPVATFPLTDNAGITALALDRTDNMYIAEPQNGFVRKIPAVGGAGTIFRQQFSMPWDIGRDAAGNIYISATASGKIEKFPSGGGSGITIASGIQTPYGIAVDAAGNVYVGNTANGLVLKIPAGGGPRVTIGSGFNGPRGLAVDAVGNVYVADSFLDAIYKIPAGGGATITLASDIGNAFSIAVDPSGNLYFTEYSYSPNNGSYNLMKMPVGGGASTLIAQGLSGDAGLATDAAGNVYIAGAGNHQIEEVVGGSGAPVVIASGFNYPTGIAVDSAGNFYVCDNVGNTITKIRLTGGYYVSPSLPPGLKLDSASGVISGEPIPAIPATNYKVTAYNISGNASTVLNITVNTPPPPTISYGGPYIYEKNHPITPATPVSTKVAVYAYNNGSILFPGGTNASVTADAAGNVYLDFGNSVEKIPAGGGSAVIVASGISGSYGLAVDKAGNLYVSDPGSKSIKEFPAGGGGPMVIGSGFGAPQALAVDEAGNVYAADANAGAVFKIPVGGGTKSKIAAGFNGIGGVAVDAAGNVYMADLNNRAIKEKKAGGSLITFITGLAADRLAVDAQGDLFFTNWDVERDIDMVPAGSNSVVRLFSGPAISGSVAIDGKGNIYTDRIVSDEGASNVIEISPSGGYFLANPLPAGLSFSSSTGVISGTPAAVAAAANYAVTAINAAGSVTTNVNIAVFDPSVKLSNIALSAGTLSPAFSTDSLNYTVTEGIGVSTLYIRPTAVDTTSIIKVNGVSVKSGKPAAVTLAAGVTTISIVVTSKDKTDSRTYTIIAGKGSQNDNLAGLSLSHGLLSPAFNPDSLNYAASVSKTTSSITVTPHTSAVTAAVTVNGITVASGTASAPITLNPGPNTITVRVTAQDGLNTQTYTVTVTRPAPAAITAGAVSGDNVTCAGDASASPSIQQFTVAGNALNGNITATAPAKFQVSLSAAGVYAHTVTLVQTGGTVSSQVVYVRLAATAPVGTASGNVVLASPGVTSQNIAVDGTVNALPRVNPVPDQTLYSGQTTKAINFTGTASSYSWVNNTVGMGLGFSGVGNIAPFTASNLGAGPVAAVITVTPEPSAGYAYITNQSSKNVSVINLANNAVVATIPVGGEPFGATVSPDGSRAYVTSSTGSTNVVSVINTSTNTVISTIPVSAYPVGICMSPDGSSVYVANYGSSRVSVINTMTNTVSAVIPLTDNPYGLAVSPDGSRLYACSAIKDSLWVINTTTKAVIASIAVGREPEQISVSPDGSLVYVLNVTHGDISIINTSSNTVTSTISLGESCGSIVLSPDGKFLYATPSSSVFTINTATHAIVANVPLAGYPEGLSLNADGSRLYADDPGTNSVAVFNTATNSLIANVPVGTSPISLGSNSFVSHATGCPGRPVDFHITVYPVISTLASLGLSAGTLSPVFSPSTNNYKTPVGADVSGMTVTPTVTDNKATVTVNGVAVVSGTASANIPLATGNNTITIVVTAGDGFTKNTYTVTVFRPLPNDANLTFMQPTAGFMSPIFTPAVTSYTDTVNYTNLALEITPIAHDSLATITVNGVPVVSGAMSQAINLNEGLNTITTVVTAPDGVTTKTFTLTVFRAFSTDAFLTQIQPSAGMLSPVFNPMVTAFADTVNNSNANITVTPMVHDPLATLTVNGAALASGATSPAIPLAAGNNIITIVVTAPDGITTKTYTLTANRHAFPLAALNSDYQPVGVAKSLDGPLLADDGLVVHQGISPNGDGINDFLVIDNITNYPDNKLSIMNRDGQLIFEAKGYDNSSKVFDGHSNKNGQMQLPGTYFYQLEYEVNGIVKYKTGFVVLKY